jgi:hypothetical protein
MGHRPSAGYIRNPWQSSFVEKSAEERKNSSVHFVGLESGKLIFQDLTLCLGEGEAGQGEGPQITQITQIFFSVSYNGNIHGTTINVAINNRNCNGNPTRTKSPKR